MGLDMYLERLPRGKTKEQLDAESDEAWEKGLDYWREHISSARRIAYWRKVNWLHGFIVNTFAGGKDDWEPIELGKGDIQLILGTYRQAADVLAGRKMIPQKHVDTKDFMPIYADDTEKQPYEINCFEGRLLDPKAMEAKLDEGYWKVERSAWGRLDEILPPTHGFFFGSYEYDNYYVWDVFETIQTLEKVLAEFDDNYRYTYSASW